MKNILLMMLLTFITFVGLHGQDLDSLKKANDVVTIRLDGPHSTLGSPLYIISVDNKRLQIPEHGNLKDSSTITNTLSFVDPAWIQSINILEGKDATDAYDSLGRNGVILIELENAALEKMSVEFSKRFKVN